MSLVADMSGAAEAVGELEHDIEETRVLPLTVRLLMSPPDRLLVPPVMIPEAVQRTVMLFRRVFAQVIPTSSTHK